MKVLGRLFTMPLHKLAMGTAFGALATLSVGMVLKRVKADSFHANPTYTKAVRMAKKHQGVQFLLGLPIKDKRVNLARPEENFTEGNNTYLRIPMSGPKGRGSLFFHAQCANAESRPNECFIQRLEFEVIDTQSLQPEEYRDRRLLVYDVQKHGELTE